MTTSDVTRGGVAPSSPTLSAAWLLRASAITAAAAGLVGIILAPGLRGNASEQVVDGTEQAAAVLAYFLVSLLVTLVVRGTLELTTSLGIGVVPRGALVAGGAAVIGLSMVGVHERAPPLIAVLTSSAAAVTALAGAYAAAHAPHTRALAGVLLAFAVASIARLAAWEIATRAGDTANVQLFHLSQSFARAGVFMEAAGWVLAVYWLRARSRVMGQLASFAAVAAAFVLTLGVAHGMRSGAASWQVIARTALVDAPGAPSPYGLEGLATFLVPASLLLAVVAAAQPKQVVAIVAAMALALVSRGAFDAPLRALCAVAAAQWAALAGVDERAMWRTLVDDTHRRTAEEDA